MPIQYNPADAETCLAEGEYEATLNKVEDRIFNSGNAGQVWHVTVYGGMGEEHNLKDYVTAAAAFKIKDLARAVGQSAAFDAGKFQADDHVNARFKVKLKVEKSDQYGDQNKIARYLVMTGTAGSFQPQKSQPAAQPAFAGIQNARPTQAAKGPVNPPYTDAREIPDSDIPFDQAFRK